MEYIEFSKRLKTEMKNCKINGYANIKKTAQYLHVILENAKYSSNLSGSCTFSENVKLYKKHHFAGIDDCKNIITEILKIDYNVYKDYDKIINLLNISDSEISDLWYLWIKNSQRYINDVLRGYCTEDKKEMEILKTIEKKSIGFYGRSGGYIGFNSEYKFDDIEYIIDLIENNEINEEFDYSTLQSDIVTNFEIIAGYKLILEDIKVIVENSSFLDELKYRYTIEIENNKAIQKIIINECKQQEFSFEPEINF